MSEDTKHASARRDEVEMMLPFYVTGSSIMPMPMRSRVSQHHPDVAGQLDLVRAERESTAASNAIYASRPARSFDRVAAMIGKAPAQPARAAGWGLDWIRPAVRDAIVAHAGLRRRGRRDRDPAAGRHQCGTAVVAQYSASSRRITIAAAAPTKPSVGDDGIPNSRLIQSSPHPAARAGCAGALPIMAATRSKLRAGGSHRSRCLPPCSRARHGRGRAGPPRRDEFEILVDLIGIGMIELPRHIKRQHHLDFVAPRACMLRVFAHGHPRSTPASFRSTERRLRALNNLVLTVPSGMPSTALASATDNS